MMQISENRGADRRRDLTGEHPCYTVGQVLRATFRDDDPAAADLPGRREPSTRRFGRRAGSEVSGIVAVVGVEHSEVIDTDDGDGQGTGHQYERRCRAQVRPATAEEAAPVLAREETQRRRSELEKRASGLFGGRGILPDAEWVERPEVGGRLLPLPARGRPPQREVRIDHEQQTVWCLVWNGADGDDWQWNNAGGYIAWKLPLTPERQELAEAIVAEWEQPEEVADQFGMPTEAAARLTEAGWTREDIEQTRRSVRITTVQDADTLLNWSLDTRQQDGWTSQSLPRPRFGAAAARRLARAGLIRGRAERIADSINRHGEVSVDQVLAAGPPHIPPEATRVRIAEGRGADEYFGHDPVEVEGFFDRNPELWTAQITTWNGPAPEHVNRPDFENPEWQLWDDDTITRGAWIHRDHVPRSLPTAGEQLVNLLVATQQGRELLKADKAGWLSVARNASHLEHEDVTSKTRPRGKDYTLVRYTITHDGGETVLWGVREGYVDIGEEDADAGEDTAVYASEREARAAYRNSTGHKGR